jgi:hypothetical protein
MFAGFGFLALLLGGDLPLGTPTRMGSGYVPRMLSFVLIGLGALIAIRAVITRSGPVEAPQFRPIIMITLGVVAFTLLIERAGFIPAGIVMIALASFGGHEFRLKEAVALCVVMLIVCTAIFKFGLGMTFALIRGVW